VAHNTQLPRQRQQGRGQQNGRGRSHQDDAERQRNLVAWGDEVLKRIGLRQKIADANTIEELQRITFDPDSTAVILAINDALHPANGERQQHFDGLTAAALKKILNNRFNDLRKDRQKQLLGGSDPSDSATVNWTEELIFDKQGKIAANVHNILVMLRYHPSWTVQRVQWSDRHQTTTAMGLRAT
jgi:hypothetical protein